MVGNNFVPGISNEKKNLVLGVKLYQIYLVLKG